jgi:hypothetical protein
MKKLCQYIIVILLVLFVADSFAQYQHAPVRLTYGLDRNPAFHVRAENYDLSNILFEFLAYERVNGNAENIMVSKINYSGPLDSGMYLTNNSFQNSNPSIGYYILNNTQIVNSIVVWETNKNGNKDIYARIYKQNQGWLGEFPVDSSAGDQSNPKVSIIGANNYAVVYQSANDIKLKVINVDNQSVVLDTNLTSGINEVCKNPFILVSAYTPFKMFISFEREFSLSQNSVYCMKADTIANPLVLAMDTVRYSGINYNSGIFNMNLNPVPYLCIYETNVNGKLNTFGTQIKWNGLSSVHHNILTSSVSDMWSYRGSGFIIGDNTVDGSYAFLNKIGSATFIRTMMNYSWDSVNVVVSNDTNYKSKITLSSANAVPNSACWRMWYAYEKNISPSDRGIFGIIFTSCAMNIRKLSESAAEYSLSQNYPNPFNPITKIRFDIPEKRVKQASLLVLLKVYDITGREVQTLVNETLQPGTYETSFDGSKFASGIYFYKLITDGFTETKKMLMIK